MFYDLRFKIMKL